MDKEQRERMACRTIVQQDEDQGDIEYTIQVSGERVEIHQDYEHPWENEEGTGPDSTRETWVMSLNVFKKLLGAGQWCVEKSAAFEKAHPIQARGKERDDV